MPLLNPFALVLVSFPGFSCSNKPAICPDFWLVTSVLGLLYQVVASQCVACVNKWPRNKSHQPSQPVTTRGCIDEKIQVANPTDASVVRIYADVADRNEVFFAETRQLPERAFPHGNSKVGVNKSGLTQQRTTHPDRGNPSCWVEKRTFSLVPPVVLAVVTGIWIGAGSTASTTSAAWARITGLTVLAIYLWCVGKQATSQQGSDRGSSCGLSALVRGTRNGVWRSRSTRKRPGRRQPGNCSDFLSGSDSDGDGHDDDEDGNEEETDEIERLMACHFFKLDPLNHHECGGYVLKSFHRVTQHLKRYHSLGQFYCRTCFKSFKNGEELATHSVCISASGRDKLDEDDVGQLRVRGANDWEKWMRVWSALFYEHDPPRSPYMEQGVAKYADTIRRLSGRRYLGIVSQLQLNMRSMPADPADFYTNIVRPLLRPPYHDIPRIYRIRIPIPVPAMQSFHPSQELQLLGRRSSDELARSGAARDPDLTLLPPDNEIWLFDDSPEIPYLNMPLSIVFNDTGGYPETAPNFGPFGGVAYLQPLENLSSNQAQRSTSEILGEDDDINTYQGHEINEK